MNDTVELTQQIEWENLMASRGVERFLANQQDARDNGRGDEAQAERRMMGHYVKALADGIVESIKITQFSHDSSDKQMLRMLDPLALSMITLKVLLSELHNVRYPLAAAAAAIGQRIEDEIAMGEFHSEYTQYFEEIVRKIEQKQTYSRLYKKNSIDGSMRLQQGKVIPAWLPVQRYRIGQRLIQIANEVCDLFEIHTIASQKKGGTFIRPTDKCLAWIQNFDNEMSLMFPDRMPMLIPPEPWTDAENGGYVTPGMRSMTPLIIKSPLATARSRKWLEIYNAAKMPTVYRAINAMQDTTWRINSAVLRVLEEVMHNNLEVGVPRSDPYEFPPCPLAAGQVAKDLVEGTDELHAFLEWKSEMRMMHELEADRKANIVNVARVIRMAREMDGKDFWYVYRCDFRGRMYPATSGLSPQGTGVAKGLLKFAEGKKLGTSGWYWFRVAGANRYGKDKISFDDRVKWIEDNSAAWKECATNPLGNLAVWGKADEPYQFLAWCIEFNNATNGNPKEYKSYLPIGMDGSCNGLQHFSAMLSDSVGGSAVNLIPHDLPSDIYQRVADVMTAKLRSMAPTSEAAGNWLALFHSLGMTGAPRQLTKKPVMTLPYGSTERSCCDSIMQWYMENAKGFFPQATAFKHALFLTPLLWQSIGDVVIAARAAMAWIRKCAGIAAKANKPLLFKSVLGFPIKQRNEKMKAEVVTTYLSGRMRVVIELPTGELDGRVMQNGSSPNFVHNCDATHECMTVDAMLDLGITSFAMVHDEYGTHAADIETMHACIRSSFVDLYTNHDVLGEFKRHVQITAGVQLPDPPPRGTLDVTQVINSKYFFS